MEFPIRRVKSERSASEGAQFLRRAKSEHEALIGKLLEKADTFSSVETYTDAIGQALWSFAESLAKESWRNGIARGQARRQRG
jgi:hypothetical protein